MDRDRHRQRGNGKTMHDTMMDLSPHHPHPHHHRRRRHLVEQCNEENHSNSWWTSTDSFYECWLVVVVDLALQNDSDKEYATVVNLISGHHNRNWRAPTKINWNVGASVGTYYCWCWLQITVNILRLLSINIFKNLDVPNCKHNSALFWLTLLVSIVKSPLIKVECGCTTDT